MMKWLHRLSSSPEEHESDANDSDPPIVFVRPPKDGTIKICTERVRLIQVVWFAKAIDVDKEQRFHESAGKIAGLYLGNLLSQITKHKTARFRSFVLPFDQQSEEFGRLCEEGYDKGWSVFVLRRTCKPIGPEGQTEMEVLLQVMVDQGQRNHIVEVRHDNQLTGA